MSEGQCQFCGQQPGGVGYSPPHVMGACPVLRAEHLLRVKILEAQLREAEADALAAEADALAAEHQVTGRAIITPPPR